MKNYWIIFVLVACGPGVLVPSLRSQVPAVLHYQGRLSVDRIAFNGVGLFKFSLVKADGALSPWQNSIDANNDGEPDLAVSVSVINGLYSVLLGDSSVNNMAA